MYTRHASRWCVSQDKVEDAIQRKVHESAAPRMILEGVETVRDHDMRGRSTASDMRNACVDETELR